MSLDYAVLKSWLFPDVEHRYSARDTMLYALGLGCGSDPTDPDELQFVFEEGLRALPTMPVVLGGPGFWMRNEKTGVDWRKILHGEQGLTLHRPLPVAGTVIGRTRIKDIVDKGRERGALMFTERSIVDKESGAEIATLTSTTVMRGDGGFGGPGGPTPAPHPIPHRAPDAALDIAILPQAALIYRLSGDMNPLHADPKIAAAAGFPRPILPGLCSFGIAGRAVLKLACGNDPAYLKHMQVRFTAPAFPGETIRTEIWRDGATVSFRARTITRSIILNNGLATIRDQESGNRDQD
jgi:acyl dehydratase